MEPVLGGEPEGIGGRRPRGPSHGAGEPSKPEPNSLRHRKRREYMSAATGPSRVASSTRESTETKASTKTSEFFVYLAAVAAILIASLVVDGFNATEGWMFFTFLSIGYMISRGLAKSGSREHDRADR